MLGDAAQLPARDAARYARGSSGVELKEVVTAGPKLDAVAARETQVGLVDECRRLKRLMRRLFRPLRGSPTVATPRRPKGAVARQPDRHQFRSAIESV